MNEEKNVYPNCLQLLLEKKASQNNTIDLNAYAIGLSDCYKEFNFHQPKAIEDNVWDEVERILYNHDQPIGTKIAMLKAKYSLIKK